MNRTVKDYIILILKGMSMGVADIVPGVSGGTIAFILGIYEELLVSISNINFKCIQILKKQGFKASWKYLNGNFLVVILIGIFGSIFLFSNAISWLLNNEPILLCSFFFGLVLASTLHIGKQITKWNLLTIFILIFGVLLAYYITMLKPLVTENSSTIFLFLAGALAICAMILPGISGAFILLILGTYEPILRAITNRNFIIIFTVGFGAIVGLLTFSKLLKWLFSKHKNYTLSVLIGFVMGSLNKIWPWKKTLTWRINSHGIKIPVDQQSISPFLFDGNNQLIVAVILAIVGFLFIIFLDRIAIKKP